MVKEANMSENLGEHIECSMIDILAQHIRDELVAVRPTLTDPEDIAECDRLIAEYYKLFDPEGEV
jgi:hypothetical protein